MCELLGRVEMERRHAEKSVDTSGRLDCVRIIVSLCRLYLVENN